MGSSPPSKSVDPELVPQGEYAGKPGMKLRKPVVVVGTAEHCHLHLVSSSVSRHHALIIKDQDGVYIRDLGSRTKVVVNGQPQRESMLADGDVIQIGRFSFKFSYQQNGSTVAKSVPARVAVDGELPLPLETRTMLIGRGEDCEIALKDQSVSSRHAVIFTVQGKRFLRDLDSRTGTFVAGKEIHQQEIKPGDEFQVGAAKIKLTDARAKAAEPAPARTPEPAAPKVAQAPPTKIETTRIEPPKIESPRATPPPAVAEESIPIEPVAESEPLVPHIDPLAELLGLDSEPQPQAEEAPPSPAPVAAEPDHSGDTHALEALAEPAVSEATQEAPADEKPIPVEPVAEAEPQDSGDTHALEALAEPAAPEAPQEEEPIPVEPVAEAEPQDSGDTHALEALAEPAAPEDPAEEEPIPLADASHDTAPEISAKVQAPVPVAPPPPAPTNPRLPRDMYILERPAKPPIKPSTNQDAPAAPEPIPQTSAAGLRRAQSSRVPTGGIPVAQETPEPPKIASPTSLPITQEPIVTSEPQTAEEPAIPIVEDTAPEQDKTEDLAETLARSIGTVVEQPTPIEFADEPEPAQAAPGAQEPTAQIPVEPEPSTEPEAPAEKAETPEIGVPIELVSEAQAAEERHDDEMIAEPVAAVAPLPPVPEPAAEVHAAEQPVHPTIDLSDAPTFPSAPVESEIAPIAPAAELPASAASIVEPEIESPAPIEMQREVEPVSLPAEPLDLPEIPEIDFSPSADLPEAPTVEAIAGPAAIPIEPVISPPPPEVAQNIESPQLPEPIEPIEEAPIADEILTDSAPQPLPDFPEPIEAAALLEPQSDLPEFSLAAPEPPVPLAAFEPQAEAPQEESPSEEPIPLETPIALALQEEPTEAIAEPEIDLSPPPESSAVSEAPIQSEEIAPAESSPLADVVSFDFSTESEPSELQFDAGPRVQTIESPDASLAPPESPETPTEPQIDFSPNEEQSLDEARSPELAVMPELISPEIIADESATPAIPTIDFSAEAPVESDAGPPLSFETSQPPEDQAGREEIVLEGGPPPEPEKAPEFSTGEVINESPEFTAAPEATPLDASSPEAEVEVPKKRGRGRPRKTQTTPRTKIKRTAPTKGEPAEETPIEIPPSDISISETISPLAQPQLALPESGIAPPVDIEPTISVSHPPDSPSEPQPEQLAAEASAAASEAPEESAQPTVSIPSELQAPQPEVPQPEAPLPEAPLPESPPATELTGITASSPDFAETSVEETLTVSAEPEPPAPSEPASEPVGSMTGATASSADAVETYAEQNTPVIGEPDSLASPEPAPEPVSSMSGATASSADAVETNIEQNVTVIGEPESLAPPESVPQPVGSVTGATASSSDFVETSAEPELAMPEESPPQSADEFSLTTTPEAIEPAIDLPTVTSSAPLETPPEIPPPAAPAPETGDTIEIPNSLIVPESEIGFTSTDLPHEPYPAIPPPPRHSPAPSAPSTGQPIPGFGGLSFIGGGTVNLDHFLGGMPMSAPPGSNAPAGAAVVITGGMPIQLPKIPPPPPSFGKVTHWFGDVTHPWDKTPATSPIIPEPEAPLIEAPPPSPPPVFLETPPPATPVEPTTELPELEPLAEIVPPPLEIAPPPLETEPPPTPVAQPEAPPPPQATPSPAAAPPPRKPLFTSESKQSRPPASPARARRESATPSTAFDGLAMPAPAGDVFSQFDSAYVPINDAAFGGAPIAGVNDIHIPDSPEFAKRRAETEELEKDFSLDDFWNQTDEDEKPAAPPPPPSPLKPAAPPPRAARATAIPAAKAATRVAPKAPAPRIIPRPPAEVKPPPQEPPPIETKAPEPIIPPPPVQEPAPVAEIPPPTVEEIPPAPPEPIAPPPVAEAPIPEEPVISQPPALAEEQQISATIPPIEETPPPPPQDPIALAPIAQEEPPTAPAPIEGTSEHPGLPTLEDLLSEPAPATEPLAEESPLKVEDEFPAPPLAPPLAPPPPAIENITEELPPVPPVAEPPDASLDETLITTDPSAETFADVPALSEDQIPAGNNPAQADIGNEDTQLDDSPRRPESPLEDTQMRSAEIEQLIGPPANSTETDIPPGANIPHAQAVEPDHDHEASAPAAFAPQPPTPKKRRRPLVPVLMAMVFLAIVGALIAIQYYVPVQEQVTGRLTFDNFNFIPGTQDAIQFESAQRRLLAAPDTRRRAFETLARTNPGVEPGFIANEEGFDRVISTVSLTSLGHTPVQTALDISRTGSDKDGDRARMLALLQAVYDVNAPALDANRRALGALDQAQRQVNEDQQKLDDTKNQMAALQSVIDAQPPVEQFNQLLSKKNQLERDRLDAENAVNRDRSDLAQLQAPPASTSTQPDLASDAQLAQMRQQIKDLTAELDAARSDQMSGAVLARQQLQRAESQFNDQIANANEVLDGGSKLRQFVDSAMDSQAKARELIDMVIIDGQDLEKQLEDTQRDLEDLIESRQAEKWAADPQLQEIRDSLESAQHRYNANVGQGVSDPRILDPLQKEIDSDTAQMHQRQQDLGVDPNEIKVQEGLSNLVQSLRTKLQKEKEQTDSVLDPLQKQLADLDPVVTAMPAAEQDLAKQIKQRLADLNDARKKYAQSVGEDQPPASAKVLDLQNQITDLKSRLVSRQQSLAQAAAAAAQARQTTDLTTAQQHLTTDQKTLDSATQSYATALAAFQEVESKRDAAVAAQQKKINLMDDQRGAFTSLESAKRDRDDKQAAAQQAFNLEPVTDASVTVIAPTDPRLIYSAIILGAGLLVMAILGLLSHFSARKKHPAHKHPLVPDDFDTLVIPLAGQDSSEDAH